MTPDRQQIDELLIRAYKYDDKPHQLYSFIAAIAKAHPSELTAEIVRLMDEAYERKREMTPDREVAA